MRKLIILNLIAISFLLTGCTNRDKIEFADIASSINSAGFVINKYPTYNEEVFEVFMSNDEIDKDSVTYNLSTDYNLVFKDLLDDMSDFVDDFYEDMQYLDDDCSLIKNEVFTCDRYKDKEFMFTLDDNYFLYETRVIDPYSDFGYTYSFFEIDERETKTKISLGYTYNDEEYSYQEYIEDTSFFQTSYYNGRCTLYTNYIMESNDYFSYEDVGNFYSLTELQDRELFVLNISNDFEDVHVHDYVLYDNFMQKEYHLIYPQQDNPIISLNVAKLSNWTSIRNEDGYCYLYNGTEKLIRLNYCLYENYEIKLLFSELYTLTNTGIIHTISEDLPEIVYTMGVSEINAMLYRNNIDSSSSEIITLDRELGIKYNSSDWE